MLVLRQRLNVCDNRYIAHAHTYTYLRVLTPPIHTYLLVSHLCVDLNYIVVMHINTAVQQYLQLQIFILHFYYFYKLYV
jgi:hypothetical protein